MSHSRRNQNLFRRFKVTQWYESKIRDRGLFSWRKSIYFSGDMMGQANAIPHSNGIVALSMRSKEISRERSASKYVDFSTGSRGQPAMNCLSCDILSSKSTGSIALLCGGLQIFVSRFLRSLSLFLSLFLFFSFFAWRIYLGSCWSIR